LDAEFLDGIAINRLEVTVRSFRSRRSTGAEPVAAVIVGEDGEASTVKLLKQWGQMTEILRITVTIKNGESGAGIMVIERCNPRIVIDWNENDRKLPHTIRAGGWLENQAVRNEVGSYRDGEVESRN
jgi:hypothetical protein